VHDLAKSRTQVFIYLIFISSVMVRVMIKVRVRFNKFARRANLVLRVIWQCEIFGMTPAVPLPDNNIRQVIHIHLPLLPSSLIWYWSKGSDALWLGR